MQTAFEWCNHIVRSNGSTALVIWISDNQFVCKGSHPIGWLPFLYIYVIIYSNAGEII